MNGDEYDNLDMIASAEHEAYEQLTAENAKLRAELAEAVRLIEDAFNDGYQGVPMDGKEWLAKAYAILKANGSTFKVLEWYEADRKDDTV